MPPILTDGEAKTTGLQEKQKKQDTRSSLWSEMIWKFWSLKDA